MNLIITGLYLTSYNVFYRLLNVNIARVVKNPSFLPSELADFEVFFLAEKKKGGGERKL
jgi:hypothetical protein